MAVTDHDIIDCAVRLHEIAPSRIIIGEEIHTTAGEIIGLFLKEYISPKLSPQDTVDKIKEQGGLVYIPHPFDHLRASVLKRQYLEELADRIDIIEAYNSRNVFPWSNTKAFDFASKRGKLLGVGSDAHSRFEVGRAYVSIEEFSDANDFLSKLSDADLHTRKTPAVFNLVNKVYKTFRPKKKGAR